MLINKSNEHSCLHNFELLLLLSAKKSVIWENLELHQKSIMIIKVMDEQMKQASSKYGNIIILYG